MNLFRSRLITLLWAFGFVGGALIGGLLYYVYPNFLIDWFVGILFFFLILESLLITYVERASRKATSKQLVNVYLLTKVVKIMLSLAFVTTYALVVKENIKPFVLVYMSLFLYFLFVETFLFMKVEKHLKEKNKKIE